MEKSEPKKDLLYSVWPPPLLLGLNTYIINYYSLYYSTQTYIYCKPPPCWRAQKINHYTFKETLSLWRKKDQAMVHRQEKKTACKNCPLGLKKVWSYLCAQNKLLKPIKFTKPKIVLFTFQISASMRHFANMLRLQNVQVDKDMQRWPFNKSRLL